MSEKIEPAVSEDEWIKIRRWAMRPPPKLPNGEPMGSAPPGYHAREIALHNFSLDDSDPRKITREMVASLSLLTDAMDGVAHERHVTRLRRLADALESYLPPE